MPGVQPAQTHQPGVPLVGHDIYVPQTVHGMNGASIPAPYAQYGHTLPPGTIPPLGVSLTTQYGQFAQPTTQNFQGSHQYYPQPLQATPAHLGGNLPPATAQPHQLAQPQTQYQYAGQNAAVVPTTSPYSPYVPSVQPAQTHQPGVPHVGHNIYVPQPVLGINPTSTPVPYAQHGQTLPPGTIPNQVFGYAPTPQPQQPVLPSAQDQSTGALQTATPWPTWPHPSYAQSLSSTHQPLAQATVATRPVDPVIQVNPPEQAYVIPRPVLSSPVIRSTPPLLAPTPREPVLSDRIGTGPVVTTADPNEDAEMTIAPVDQGPPGALTLGEGSGANRGAITTVTSETQDPVADGDEDADLLAAENLMAAVRHSL